jgi:hypothetical protein
MSGFRCGADDLRRGLQNGFLVAAAAMQLP